jgi:hypothetical protein
MFQLHESGAANETSSSMALYQRTSTTSLSKCIQVLLLVCAAFAAAPAHAAVYNQVLDGATCTPPSDSKELSVPFDHFLHTEGGTVFCHLTMSSDWPAVDLSYAVIFGALSVGKTASARLCVHDYFFKVTCGDPALLRGQGSDVNTFSNFANAPNPIRGCSGRVCGTLVPARVPIMGHCGLAGLGQTLTRSCHASADERGANRSAPNPRTRAPRARVIPLESAWAEYPPGQESGMGKNPYF